MQQGYEYHQYTEHADKLSEEQMAILEVLKGCGGKYASEYTEDEEAMVYAAVHSGNRALVNAAALAVHNSLYHYEMTFAKHYGVTRRHDSFEEYMQEFFCTILQNLPKWSPEKGKLTTFFQSYFKNTCTRTNNLYSPFQSRHYENVNADISKALAGLEQEGNMMPTAIEIRDYIENSIGHRHSEKTISNCLQQRVVFSPIESGKEIAGGGRFSDPLQQVMEVETRDEILSCIRMLEPQHRIIMEIEHRLYESALESGKKIKIRELTNEIKKEIPGAKDEWVKRIRASAEREFANKWKRLTKKHAPAARRIQTDCNYLPQLNEDIKRAAMVDLDNLFGD